MRFLLDTNIGSAWIRGQRGLTGRFVQYGGRLYLSTVSLSELYVWAHKKEKPDPILNAIDDLLQIIDILPFDEKMARIAGRIRGPR